MFNIKKGSVVVYSGNWNFKYFQNNSLVLQSSKNSPQDWYRSLKHKYQFTSLTSRLTSYMLLSFWIFFFFFGESLLMVLFNYSTPIDTIESSNFLVIKQHVIFFLQTTSSKLLKYINFLYFFWKCRFHSTMIFIIPNNNYVTYKYFSCIPQSDNDDS
jgi:hypothetical protein